MRNISCYTTEYGIASLVLKEIPYRNTAYVRLQSVLNLDKLVEECRRFCHSAGADNVYAAGHEGLSKYPLHTVIQSMQCAKDIIPDTNACLFPVTDQTLDQWREIYNEKMKFVDNATYLTIADAKELLEKKSLYYVHKDGVLIGIGVVDGEKVDCVASVVKGAGREVMLALCHSIFAETVSVEVATTNKRAVGLYDALGFIPTSIISTWYKIL